MLIDKFQERVIKLGVFFGVLIQIIMWLIPLSKHILSFDTRLILFLILIVSSIFHFRSKTMLANVTVSRRWMSFHKGCEIALNFFVILWWWVVMIIFVVVHSVLDKCCEVVVGLVCEGWLLEHLVVVMGGERDLIYLRFLNWDLVYLIDWFELDYIKILLTV